MRVAAAGRTATVFMQGLCCALVFWFSGAVFASDALGLSWLQAQVRADGSLAQEGASAALPVQSRAEVATTLQAMAGAVPVELLTAIDQASGTSVEILARKALARQLTAPSTAYLDALAQQQNPDGGFGAAQDYASNVQDTAWALAAFAALQNTYSAETSRAITWLISVQQPNGAWALSSDSDAAVPTAAAVAALQPYRQSAPVASAQAKARAWLLSERDTLHAWGSSLRNALALWAVLPGMTNAASVQPAVDALRSSQRVDGSWESDPYTTALALRALRAASQPVTDPDMASLQGVVVDADTGVPIAGASVRLLQRALHATTDASGTFRFALLNEGADQLDVQAAGYRTVSSVLDIQKGQQLNLGTIRLNASAGGAASGVTLTGVARYFNGNSYYNAYSAKVQAAGKSATADSNGNYRIDGLPAGKVDVVATFGSYPSIQASITAQDGQTVGFNPVFQNPPSSSAALTVQVMDGKTGMALPGVLVQLPPSQSRITDAQGRAIFAAGLVAGRNTVVVSKAGYERATLSVNAVDGQNILLTVSLQPTTGSETVLRGVVTDADTLQPLAGVQVLVVEAQMQTVTDAQGAYALADAKLAGSRTVEFSKAGYQMHSQAISIAGAVVNVFNVPLPPGAVAPGPARLDVTVVERGTGQPVGGAQVQLSGANQHTVVVDAAGLASAANLNPGETQITVSAPGFESAVTSVNVKAGYTYVMPVELLRAGSPIHKLYGHIVDAVSQQPVSAAQVVLTGATAGTVTTAANGYYEFDNVVLGDVQITVTANGYLTAQRDFRMDGTTEAKLALTPSWQVVPSSAWSVVGSVVDADTLTPIVGADLVLEEVLPGSAVVSVQKAATQTGGSLAFDGLKETNARLTLSMNGYDTSVIPLTRQGSSQSLGVIKLKRSYNAALPDLILGMADRSSLLQDASTFKATGKVTARVTNNSNYDATGFDVIAFLDADGDQTWNPATDTLLGKTRVGALSAQQSLPLEWELHAAPLPFRDAPIHLMVDSGLEVIENIEGNNTLRVGVSCSGGGGIQDVGVCIDTSGSVAHLYNLEMEGVIKAVENPNIIPHDGSIRFMLGTDAEMYFGNGIPLHTARILTPATLPQLIQDLKSKNIYGGYSSGPTCVRRMSEYMKTLPQLSGSKTVITVGDGYWEGIPQAIAQLPVTVANGVNRVDVIGVGSVNLPELEANAWPKPVNTLRGGRVTVAYSSGDVAAAMAQALGSAVQSVDMTLGGFRLVDQGQGNPVALHARVGNGGTASQPTTVRWYQGANLLGETAVPAMRSGEWLDVTLPTLAIQGAEDLIAVVDEQHVNSECNTGNNLQRLALSPSNRLGSLVIRTDQASYHAQAPVQLSGLVENLGQFPARFSIVFRVLDEHGDEVHHFAAVDLGTLATQSPYTHVQQWNTSTLPAGTYRLQGYLLDEDGVEVAQDSAPFTITAGNGQGGPKASLSVSVDKAEYPPNDRVRISSLARNLTLNAALDDAYVRITVRDPSNTVVYQYTHTNGQLMGNAMRANDTQQSLKNATPGKYTVEAVLIGSGNNLKAASLAGKQTKAYDVGVALATATATYTVKAAPLGGPGSPGGPGAPGAAQAIPINQPWLLWFMALGLAWVAGRPLRTRTRQASLCAPQQHPTH